jgi:hypothetical protein
MPAAAPGGLDNELSVQEDAGCKSCTLQRVLYQRRYVSVIFNDKDQRGFRRIIVDAIVSHDA